MTFVQGFVVTAFSLWVLLLVIIIALWRKHRHDKPDLEELGTVESHREYWR